jgi:hypothetical protein
MRMPEVEPGAVTWTLRMVTSLWRTMIAALMSAGALTCRFSITCPSRDEVIAPDDASLVPETGPTCARVNSDPCATCPGTGDGAGAGEPDGEDEGEGDSDTGTGVGAGCGAVGLGARFRNRSIIVAACARVTGAPRFRLPSVVPCRYPSR